MRNVDLRALQMELRKKELEIRRLRNLAVKDELTGVYNKRGFKEALEKILPSVSFASDNENVRRYFVVDALSLLFFDIDNFKKINDAYGHKTGDVVLRRVSDIISKKVRSIDIVGRLGGEELAVVLVGSDETNAYRKAEEIRKTIRRKLRVSVRSAAPVTVSVGVAQLRKNMMLDELIKAADKAMYRAKQSGKDKSIKFSDLEV